MCVGARTLKPVVILTLSSGVTKYDAEDIAELTRSRIYRMNDISPLLPRALYRHFPFRLSATGGLASIQKRRNARTKNELLSE